MARTPIAAQALGGAYPTITANSRDLAEVAGNAVDGNSTPIVNGKTLLVAHNTDSGAHTVTIDSTPDALGREGDITAYSIGAGEIATFGPFKRVGWEQDDVSHLLHWTTNDATVKFAVITLP